MALSAVDCCHVPFVLALAGGRGKVVQPFDLRRSQLDAVGRSVFLDAGHSLGASNRSDVIALCEEPGQSDLSRCCTHLGGTGLDLADNAQVAPEVLAGEAGVGPPPCFDKRVRLEPTLIANRGRLTVERLNDLGL